MHSESAVVSTLAGDPFLSELVELYVQEMPERIAHLEALADARQWDELARAAHQLKGSAGGYGFGTLTAPADRLEQLIRSGGPEPAILEALHALVQLCRRVRASPT